MSEPAPQRHTPGGYRELIALSLPLILSASFWTVQIFIDRVFIAMVSSDALAATMPTVLYFWTPFVLLNSTALYATVFVAQYTGAGRPGRIGPVVWQALRFSLVTGLLFPLLTPAAGFIIGLTEHTPAVKVLELEYFRALSLVALPMLIVASVNSFFAGRGDSWTVLLINAVGMTANAALAYPLIVMRKHDPIAAMHGAGYAAALGSSVSAVLGLVLLFRKKYRAEFATVSGWRFDRALFGRLMKFGLPNGVQWCIDGLAFTVFLIIVGNIGVRELAGTNLTFSLNMLAFLPVFGLAQGVEVLVGQRQGESRPDLSAKTTWTGVKVATGYMVVISTLYCTIPGIMTIPFARGMEPHEWAAVAPLIPILLRFVAAYSLVDGLNVILAFALRGAGDVRFVTIVSIALAWPVMVFPTYLAWRLGWGLEFAWGAATAYIASMAVVFVVRFRHGKWRTMKVIEAAPADPDGTPATGEKAIDDDPAKQPAA
ncbi:MAG TPA: MATE family efflux transporter [Fimbriiglobus sp.]|nr:MATE family efflux transporter [Fimbriiglobus sp.]